MEAAPSSRRASGATLICACPHSYGSARTMTTNSCSYLANFGMHWYQGSIITRDSRVAEHGSVWQWGQLWKTEIPHVRSGGRKSNEVRVGVQSKRPGPMGAEGLGCQSK